MNLFPVYSLYDVEPVKGCGNRIYDSQGTEYLDFYGGHAVISIGHSNPHYVEMICNQVSKLGFYSNFVQNPLQKKLAEKLGKLSGYEDYSLFLANSGAEANENAVKVASFQTGKSRVLAFKGAFHGRTSGAVELTDIPKYRAPFNLSDNVTFVPLNDLEAVNKELASGEYCAVIIEGIQGVAGIHMPSDDFLRELRQTTTSHGVCLILDEVQSGYGRSGRFFAHQYSGIRPDIIVVAKGMGNGFPIGGVLIAPHFTPWIGMLGTTFGGNHLACAAAIAVLDVIEDQNLVANAEKVGDYLISQLKALPNIKEVRGRGLMIGVEIEGSVSELRKRLIYEKHIFTGGAGEHTLRLLPALGITKEDADIFLKAFVEVLSDK